MHKVIEQLSNKLTNSGINHDFVNNKKSENYYSIQISKENEDRLCKVMTTSDFLLCASRDASCKSAVKKWIGFDKESGDLILVSIFDLKHKKIQIPDAINKYIIIPKKGLTIAFLGQDGAGKSTVTSQIIKWLDQYFETAYYYLGNGEKFTTWEKNVFTKIRKRQFPLRKLLTLILRIRIYVKVSKHAIKSSEDAKNFSEEGGFALFDRFPQTQFYGINDGPKIRDGILKKLPSKLFKPFILRYANKEEKNLRKAENNTPDIIIKLLLSPEESIRRKPDCTFENINKKHEVVKSLKYPGANIYEVDASQEYFCEISEIKTIIWRNLQQKCNSNK